MILTWRDVATELAGPEAVIREDVPDERGFMIAMELKVPGAVLRVTDSVRGDPWRSPMSQSAAGCCCSLVGSRPAMAAQRASTWPTWSGQMVARRASPTSSIRSRSKPSGPSSRRSSPTKERVRSDQGGLGSTVGQPAMRHGVRGKEARATASFMMAKALPSDS